MPPFVPPFSDSEQDDDDDDATPAPTAATIALIVAAETTENSFVDNYCDDADESLSEKMVHYVGGNVLPEHYLGSVL